MSDYPSDPHDAPVSKIPVPKVVFGGIEAVRRSGLTNMLDCHAVAHLAQLDRARHS